MALAATGRLESPRDRLSRLTDSPLWELVMAALAVVFVWVSFANERVSAGMPSWWLEVGLTGFFVLEFATRLLASRDRTEYALDHWVDAVSLIPVVRGLRVLRLLRLVRVAASVQRASLRFKRLERVRTLVNLVIAWLVVMVIGAVSFYAAESSVNPGVRDFSDALWWAVTTITGGQNEILASTEDGRWAAVVLLVGGVALFAAITASVLRLLGADESDEFTHTESADRDVQLIVRSILDRRTTGAIDDATVVGELRRLVES